MRLTSKLLPHEVTAVFKGRFLTFPFPRDATLADLTMRLAGLGRHHEGLPVYVDVKIG